MEHSDQNNYKDLTCFLSYNDPTMIHLTPPKEKQFRRLSSFWDLTWDYEIVVDIKPKALFVFYQNLFYQFSFRPNWRCMLEAETKLHQAKTYYRQWALSYAKMFDRK